MKGRHQAAKDRKPRKMSPECRGIHCQLCDAVFGWPVDEPLPHPCPVCNGHGKVATP